MKSILQEASSIERAIDKAWNEAGKPKSFTIKVLDEGEKNFFGLSRRPAIVSIMYEPEVVRERNAGKSGRSRTKKTNKKQSAPRVAGEQRTSSQTEPKGEWLPEWREYVENTLTEIIALCSVTTKFAITTDRKILTVAFDKEVFSDSEEQRMFFASLSYISIQLLKRHYKSRFIGFKVVVTAKSSEPVKSVSKSEPVKKEESTQESVERAPRKARTITERTERSERKERRPRDSRRDNRHDKKRSEMPTFANEQESEIASEQMAFAQEQLKSEVEEMRRAKEAQEAQMAAQAFYVLPDDAAQPEKAHATESQETATDSAETTTTKE